ncbi:MAG: archaellin/type IV pilin N-terminal domain-containing protein [Candidatus Nezhaarchaeales archaeon]
MKREHLEYVSEGLFIIGVCLFIFDRARSIVCGVKPFQLFDIGVFIIMIAYLWSRGYAEYLESMLEGRPERKGVSCIIACLLLILITVSLALVLYGFANDYVNCLIQVINDKTESFIELMSNTSI